MQCCNPISSPPIWQQPWHGRMCHTVGLGNHRPTWRIVRCWLVPVHVPLLQHRCWSSGRASCQNQLKQDHCTKGLIRLSQVLGFLCWVTNSIPTLSKSNWLNSEPNSALWPNGSRKKQLNPAAKSETALFFFFFVCVWCVINKSMWVWFCLLQTCLRCPFVALVDLFAFFLRCFFSHLLDMIPTPVLPKWLVLNAILSCQVKDSSRPAALLLECLQDSLICRQTQSV